MLADTLANDLDLLAFLLLAGLAFALAVRSLPAHARQVPFPLTLWPLLALLLVNGPLAAYLAGERERDRLVSMLVGAAPTFAFGMERLGVRELDARSPADSPVYLALLAAQKRWLAANPGISDIYCLEQAADGSLRFIVDSETDYNHDGDFDDDAESRTPIGTRYPDTSGEVGKAFASGGAFSGHIDVDAWGSWVSAYEPLGRNAAGNPIMLGVDYAAGSWVRGILFQRVAVLCLFGVLVLGTLATAVLMRIARADVDRERHLQRQLQEALARAEQANRAKSGFLASMSHEIRTPMNGVLGMLQLMRLSQLDTEQSEYVETAYRSGDSLLAILDEILDLSNIEAGLLKIHPAPCAPRELVADVIALHAPVANSRGTTLRAVVADEVPVRIEADAARLRQVLNNLVGNALKFAPGGLVELTVSPAPRETPRAPSQRLRVVVRDNGIGIPADRRATLFEPYTQADNSIARRFGGTGLGLAISKRIVVAMGGEIGVESIEGSGSTFWFELPLTTP